MAKNKEEEKLSIKMEIYFKVNVMMINVTDTVLLNLLMETFMKGPL